MAEQLHTSTSQDTNERISLSAGAISAVFEPDTGYLRYVTVGGHEVLRGVYVAVRNKDWGTVPSKTLHIEHEKSPNAFKLRFEVECIQDEINFRWQGLIVGKGSGTLKFIMSGNAQSSFIQNRIGICVLHPIRECAGHPCWVEGTDGSLTYGRFPDDIEPWKPYTNFRAISYQVQPDLMARVCFAGEVFELEDHRNWTDAAFKSYPVPAGQSGPQLLKAGSRLDQSITLTLEGQLPKLSSWAPKSRQWTTIVISGKDTLPLPDIGFETAGHARPLGQGAITLLELLRPTHLRVPLHLGNPTYRTRMRTAVIDAQALGVPIEAALFASEEDYELEFSALAAEMRRLRARIAMWHIFRADSQAVSKEMLCRAHQTLLTDGEQTPIGSGSNQHFSQIIRDLPPIFDIDALCYPVNPQMHHSDDASMVETLEAQGWTVNNARRIAWNKPVIVSPVTLIRRHRLPASASPAHEEERRLLQSDPRQMSLFGAAWTVGSLKYLAQAGATALTFYETDGWAGVMDTHAADECVFPMYHVFADVAEYTGGTILMATSSAPLVVDAVALQQEARLGVLVANFTNNFQLVRLECPDISDPVHVRSLDHESVGLATRSPKQFRNAATCPIRPEDGSLMLELMPHSVLYVTTLQTQLTSRRATGGQQSTC